MPPLCYVLRDRGGVITVLREDTCLLGKEMFEWLLEVYSSAEPVIHFLRKSM